jgi:hypothetical protein
MALHGTVPPFQDPEIPIDLRENVQESPIFNEKIYHYQ